VVITTNKARSTGIVDEKHPGVSATAGGIHGARTQDAIPGGIARFGTIAAGTDHALVIGGDVTAADQEMERGGRTASAASELQRGELEAVEK